jgi:Concanavalin A-like lectin/glucanases superfamily
MKMFVFLAVLVSLSAFGQAPLPNSATDDSAHSNVGGATFSYVSTFFAANAYMSKTANLTGVSDSASFLFSTWIKFTANFDQCYILAGDSAYILIKRDASDFIHVTCFNASATIVLEIHSGGNQINSGAWHHFAVSVDLGTAGRRQLYIDGVDVTTQTTFTSGQTMHFTPGGWGIDGASDGSHVDANQVDFCEYYLAVGNAWFDLSVTANLQLLRTAGGKPAGDLTSNGAPSPVIYFKNSTWSANSGSGGAFVQNGTITDGGTDKP